MGKTKIDWATDSINVVTGCLNNCDYCYARKMAFRLKGRFGYPKDEPFRPTFHPDKLDEIYNLRGAHHRIFLDSMGDWYSNGVEEGWIIRVLDAIRCKDMSTFLILTKRPDRIPYLWTYPRNLWFGTTITKQNDLWRLDALKKNAEVMHKFVSFEPLHGPIKVDLSDIDWVIIGAESGNRKGKIVPEVEWVQQICHQAKGKPVFLKNNLRSVMSIGQLPLVKLRHEFPVEMI